MSEQVLPELARGTKYDLPADPRDLLSEDEKVGLEKELERLARLRRDAEVTSATLRLA